MAASPEKQGFSLALLRRIFTYVQPYRSRWYLSIGLSIALAFAAPLRPYLIQLTVDKAVGHAVHIPAWLQWVLGSENIASTARFLIAVTVFQIGFLLFETALRFIFTFITSWLGQTVVRDMRVAVFDKILGLNLRQFDTTPIGQLTTRTVNDIENINDIFSDGLIPIIADLLSIIVTVATMFWIDWRLTLISLAPFPLLILATYYFKESVNRSFVKVRNAVSALNSFVQEHITGMMVVQAFAAEDREMNKFVTINKQHRNANIRAIFAYSVFFPVVEVVLAISMGLLVWWLAGRAAGAPLDDSLAGKLAAFTLFLNQIFRPLRMIADKFNVLQMGMIASERVFKVMDNPDVTPESALQQAHENNNLSGNGQPEPVEGRTITPRQARGDDDVTLPDLDGPQQSLETGEGFDTRQFRGSVAFEQVWFAYNEPNYVLKDISFEVKAGQTLALVGHTGSGKTSIISLLNRMYTIQKGKILLDGVSIDQMPLSGLRRKIGVVLQDVFLFSGSVMDNITLRNPAITKESVVNAARLIGVHDFIMSLPGGYSYDVRERGNTLSLGQRQLLSFIRALLYNPEVLVLDEATSSIDTESELLIQHATEKLVAGRTAIIIAHRLSTIRRADRIVVLDKGIILETGNHEELLAQGGHYAQLYQMQVQREVMGG